MLIFKGVVFAIVQFSIPLNVVASPLEQLSIQNTMCLLVDRVGQSLERRRKFESYCGTWVLILRMRPYKQIPCRSRLGTKKNPHC
jgi:hypothetical protein